MKSRDNLVFFLRKRGGVRVSGVLKFTITSQVNSFTVKSRREVFENSAYSTEKGSLHMEENKRS